MAASGFTIPNEADAGHANQARLFETDIDILVAGISGEGVVSGCAVSDNATGLQVDVAAGTVKIGGAEVAVGSGTLTPGAADGTNPRFDLVVVNSSGTKSVTAGTAAASPKPPAVPASSVALATLYIRAGATTLASADIIDKRAIIPSASASHSMLDEIHATTTVVNTSSETDLYTKALPVLAAGDVVRFRAFGDSINNSGATRTLTLKVKLGATTILTSPAMSFTANANRGEWNLDVLLIIESTTAQRLGAFFTQGTVNASTWNTISSTQTISGAGTATEDVSSAKTLAVTATWDGAALTTDIRLLGAVLEKIT